MVDRRSLHVASRAKSFFFKMNQFLVNNRIESYRQAGSSMALDDWGDIDLFPLYVGQFKREGYVGAEILSETPNAVTLELPSGVIVQLCSYHHPTLGELVDSFDFSHIQIGVECEVYDECNMFMVDSYWSDDYEGARFTGSTWFTGSEYPLASLTRLSKYYERGHMSRSVMIGSTINIVASIIERGYGDYEDFKDQLDAVDLGLVPEELGELEYADLIKLFELLRRG